MKLVRIFFPGEVLPRIIMMLDEKAGDQISIDPITEKLVIRVASEELEFSEFSHYMIDDAVTESQESKLTEWISKFLNGLDDILSS